MIAPAVSVRFGSAVQPPAAVHRQALALPFVVIVHATSYELIPVPRTKNCSTLLAPAAGGAPNASEVPSTGLKPATENVGVTSECAATKSHELVIAVPMRVASASIGSIQDPWAFQAPPLKNCSVPVFEKFVLQPRPTHTELLNTASAFTRGPDIPVVVGPAPNADHPVVALNFATR